MKKGFKLLVLASIGTLIGLTACSEKQTRVESGNELGILHKGNQSEPEDLDHQILTGLPEYKIVTALFEGLVTLDPVNLQPVPGVAERWTISEDGKTYTFYLRKNAKWSNGDPITADDFVFSYKRALSRNLGCSYANQWYSVIGAEAYHKAEIDDFNQVGIKAVDNHTLTIKHNKPVPYFLMQLNTYGFLPVHKSTILAHGTIDERGTKWTRPSNIVSNGPFKLKRWEISQVIELEKNEHYWDYNTVKLNGIHFYPVEDQNTEERLFRTGQLHVTERIPLPKIQKYKDSSASELKMSTFFSTYAYTFNTKVEPFQDKRVRQAFSMALDRQAIVDNVSKRGEEVAFSYTPPKTAGYTASTTLQENIEDARQLLAEAGFPNGDGFPRVSLLYNTSDNHKSIAEALQHQWKKSLNVDIELVNQEWKVYLAERKGNEHGLVRFGWMGDYLDPNAFLQTMTTDYPLNLTSWSNQQYDHLIKQASQTINQKKRHQYFDKAENILMEELPILPLFYWTTAYLMSDSVKGWSPNVMDLHPWKHVYLSQE